MKKSIFLPCHTSRLLCRNTLSTLLEISCERGLNELIKTFICTLNIKKENKISQPIAASEILNYFNHSIGHKTSYDRVRDNLRVLQEIGVTVSKETTTSLIAMPADFNLIANNSMKLFSYLSLISKPISSPENIQMFQHKNLVLSNIQKATGITDKTAKFYLYHLEKEGLIQYKGGGRSSSNEEQTSHIHLQQEDTESYQDFVVRQRSESFRVWKERNKKEKEGIYHIPQFSPCLLIPEVTLKKTTVGE